jgi:hypothetical protein
VLQQGGAPDLLEVALIGQDQLPIGHVKERGQHVVAQPEQLLGQAPRGVGGDQQQHGPERREQSACAPLPKLDPVVLPVLRALTLEQRRDQEPADHEEQLDAQETSWQPADVRVVEHDRQHRDCAHAIQSRDVTKARRRFHRCRQDLLSQLPQAWVVLRWGRK